MAADPQALSTVPPEPMAATDYEAICAAVAATARGRWFLDEFAKRNRNSDTSQVLAAIARMEAAVVGERAQQASREAHQEVQIELLEMARTIAQARAEVAESRPLPSQSIAAGGADTLSTDVAAAAERLRQIAWTMRACGIELPASEQIAQVADTILSADALRDLGEQRAQKLTRALTYLEQRIDRMLEGQRAGATDAQPSEAAAAANRNEGDAPSATTAMEMIAAAMRANAAAAAEVAAAPSPATTPPEGKAAAAADVAEYPMDDDVVLTVADSAVAPAAAASLAADTIEASLTGDSELAANASDAASLDAPVALEIEPLASAQPSAAEDVAEARLGGLALAPPVVTPAVPAEQPIEPQPSAVEEAPAVTADEPRNESPADLSTADVVMAEPRFDAPPPTAAPDTADLSADDNLPMAVAADAPATAEPNAAGTDAIALQVDQDLDHLVAAAPPADADGDAADQPPAAAAAAPPRPQLVRAAEREEEPAKFPLEESPRKVAVSALVASAQASRAQLSDTLAAIESELFGSTRPPADTPAGPADASVPATPAPDAHGPLAALKAMSQEERIALFS
jgi:hypothetical protein